jgi:RNA polymerase sigma-70 factor (ECF subfamily)
MGAVSETFDIPRDQTVALEFEAAWNVHRDRVYRWALRFMAGDAAAAEDLVQEAFIRLLNELPKLDQTQDLGGWLYLVTANLAFDRLRRSESWAGRFKQLFMPPEPVPTPEQLHAKRHEAHGALKALKALGGREAVVLSMKVLDGHSQVEIARMLRLSEGQVSKLLARAWARLEAAGWEVGDE